MISHETDNWDEFIEHMKSISPVAKAEIEKIDRLVDSISAVMDGLKEMDMVMAIYNAGEVPEEIQQLGILAAV